MLTASTAWSDDARHDHSASLIRVAALAADHRVQLGAFRVPLVAASAWKNLATWHSDLLGGLEPCIQEADLGSDMGVFYRLQVGPLENTAAARSICSQLNARDQDCLVVPVTDGDQCRALRAPTEDAKAVPARTAAVTPVMAPPPVAGEPAPPAEPALGETTTLAAAIATTSPIPTSAEPSKAISVEFDFESPPKARYQLTPMLSYGAKLEFDLEYEKNYDLDSGIGDDRTKGTPELKLGLLFEPDPRVRAFVQLDIERQFLLDGPSGESGGPTKLNVTLAHLTIPRIVDGLAFQIGRQRFKDPREWLYDEKLDAARLYYQIGPIGFELSASREELVDKNLLDKSTEREIDNYFLVGRYAWSRDSEVSVYVLGRNDRSVRDRDFVFFGLRSMGEISSNAEYWIDLAHINGSDRSNDIEGYGFDLGTTYVFNTKYEPSLTLGAAFGTGDRDRNDGVDKNFRQTGLEDNSAKFNGVTRLKYYGEVLDPELSNIFILTAGTGIRPTRRSSVDLVYHYYRQATTSTRLRGADIDDDPQGLDHELGHEVDLVAGYREFEDIDVELVLGVFVPTDAFRSNADNAYFTGFEISYNF